MNKKMLIIGGTGIVGKPTVFRALKEGFDVITISISKDSSIPSQVNQVIADKHNKEEFSNIIEKLSKNTV